MPGAHPHVSREHDQPEERWGDIVAWRTLISADRTPTHGLTVGTAEIQPGAPTEGGCHRHAVPEVYYVIAGSGIVHVDGTPHPAEAGTAMFIPADAWHYAVNTGTEPLRLLYAFAVDGFDEVVYDYGEPGVRPV